MQKSSLFNPGHIEKEYANVTKFISSIFFFTINLNIFSESLLSIFVNNSKPNSWKFSGKSF